MRWIWGMATAVAMTGLGGAAMTQDAPPAEAPATEVMQAEAPAGPQWKVFSRSGQSNYLIDLSSVRPEGEELRVSIARVANAGDAGNYAHVVDIFGIRCAAAETQVLSSTEVFEDGEGSETFETGEPWTAVRPRSLDEAIKDLACDDLVPSGAAHASIRAYIDAGRP
jgi:hypothetical protein